MAEPVPFGYAIWGVEHAAQHAKLAAGYPVQCWYPQECCFAYPSFYPALWGTRYWTPIERVRALAAANPGRTWLLWNEPEPELYYWNPAPLEPDMQACINPTNARDITIEWVNAIRASGGKVAGWGCSITGVNSYARGAWRKWHDKAIAQDFPMPDYWHIHVYAPDVAQWLAQYNEFQAWNAEFGGNLQIIVSESGSGPEVYEFLKTWTARNMLACMWFTRFDANEEPYLA